MSCGDIFLGFLAILFPPLPGTYTPPIPRRPPLTHPPVWIKRGICSVDSLLNILLSCIGWIPGLIHAWYIIARFPEPDLVYEAIPEEGPGGRVTYYYVSRQPAPQGPPTTGQPDGGRAHRDLQRAGNQYGTLNQGPPPNGEGAADGTVPPTYAEAVKGDNKVQT